MSVEREHKSVPHEEEENTQGTFFKVLAEHSRDFAAFTMEIFSDVKVGVADTMDSVVEVVTDSRERIFLNELVEGIMKRHLEKIARFDNVQGLQHTEETYLEFINR